MKNLLTKLARLAVVLGAALSAPVALAAPTVTYYHNDLAGSPVVATNAQGQVIWRESYRPYGERLTNAPLSAPNDIWFTSRRQDAETGLVYMGARYYDPVVGRFYSTDSAGFVEGNVHSFNRYAYANNNPARFRDPTGAWAEEIVGAFSLALSIEAARRDPSLANLAILGTDVVLTAIPGIPAFAGAAVHGSAAAASIAAKASGDHIALGLREGLRPFAESVAARHLLDDGSRWKANFLRAVGDSNAKFSFRIDGLNGAGVEGKVTASLERYRSGNFGNTDYEIAKLHEAGRLPEVQFFENGRRLDNPF